MVRLFSFCSPGLSDIMIVLFHLFAGKWIFTPLRAVGFVCIVHPSRWLYDIMKYASHPSAFLKNSIAFVLTRHSEIGKDIPHEGTNSCQAQ
jgi:hypothetical protein